MGANTYPLLPPIRVKKCGIIHGLRKMRLKNCPIWRKIVVSRLETLYVEISEFFCHCEFTWNQFSLKFIRSKNVISTILRLSILIFVKIMSKISQIETFRAWVSKIHTAVSGYLFHVIFFSGVSASKSAGMVGKWGFASFTSIRNASAMKNQGSDAIARPKKFFKSKNSSNSNATLDSEFEPIVQAPVSQPQVN